MKRYDCVIIGAGPAGCSASIPLITSGHSVLIIDMEAFPKEKICGDGLANDSVEFLKKIHLWDQISKESYCCPEAEIYSSHSRFNLKSPVYTIKRKLFDEIMFNDVISKGAEFIQATFTGKISDKGCNKLISILRDNSEDEIECGNIIIATGCKGITKLRKSVSNCEKSDLVAIRGYYKSNIDLKNSQIYFSSSFKSGYFWIFPMGGNRFNIGCGCKVKECKKIKLKTELNRFIKDKLSTNIGKWIEEPKGALLRTNLSNLNKKIPSKTILVGDALGTTQPFSGEGIGKALQSGYLAGEITSDHMKEPTSDIWKTFRKRFKKEYSIKYKPYRIASCLLTSGLTGRIFFSMIAKSSRLQRLTSELLNETRNPNEIFSLKGFFSLIRSEKHGN